MPDDLIAPSLTGCWLAPAADLSAALAAPVFAALAELGLLQVDGADATSFLQGQLTNDVAAIGAGDFRLDGYCTAKGRLLAVFDHWHNTDAHFLQLPLELAATTAQRLSKFVLRAKAHVADVSSRWRSIGLLGPGLAPLLDSIVPSLPNVGTRVDLAGGGWLARGFDAPAAGARYQLIVPVASFDGWCERLRDAGVRAVDAGVWWWAQVDAAVPQVVKLTQERFVPQMVNLEVLDGVNFRKGCYPGQEVVARSQYLGKLRRRMHRGHLAELVRDLHAGTDVFRGSGAATDDVAAGTVILAAAAPDGGLDLLFEITSPSAGSEMVWRVGGPDGPTIAARTLPYQLRDVTA